MFLRLVRFTLSEGNRSASQAVADDLVDLTEGNRSAAQAIADDLIPAIKQQAGCQSAVFFGGGKDGECGIAVLWDSQEHADAAAAIISPRLQQHVAGKVNGPPDIRLFPVLAS